MDYLDVQYILLLLLSIVISISSQVAFTVNQTQTQIFLWCVIQKSVKDCSLPLSPLFSFSSNPKHLSSSAISSSQGVSSARALDRYSNKQSTFSCVLVITWVFLQLTFSWNSMHHQLALTSHLKAVDTELTGWKQSTYKCQNPMEWCWKLRPQ